MTGCPDEEERMPDRRKVIGGAIVVAAIVVVGAVAALRFLGGDEPPPAALSSPSASDEAAATDPAAGGSGSADGSWTIDAESGSLADATSTFAGYRIEEELGTVGTNTAVGRTQDVSGSMTVEGTAITAMSVEVDMTTLRSDDDRRDDQLSMRGLETSAFPTATFELTEPIALGAEPAEGETVSAEATGELSLHGVTREVTVPIEAVWRGDSIEAVASFDVALADHEIEPPTGFLVLSIADRGTVELHLLFEPA
jgi:polyisoprenoid-binding protein YceI